MSTWEDRDPDGVPARWLRGELSSDAALTLAYMSGRLDWRLWAERLLAVSLMKPADVVTLTV